MFTRFLFSYEFPLDSRVAGDGLGDFRLPESEVINPESVQTKGGVSVKQREAHVVLLLPHTGAEAERIKEERLEDSTLIFCDQEVCLLHLSVYLEVDTVMFVKRELMSVECGVGVSK